LETKRKRRKMGLMIPTKELHKGKRNNPCKKKKLFDFSSAKFKLFDFSSAKCKLFDFSSLMQLFKETEVEKSTVSVDVAIIGNGPSGMALSYMLDGNVPYYSTKNGPHPNMVLHQKLAKNMGLPLYLQDIGYLQQGLEGRGNNQQTILFDNLIRPQADIDPQPSRLEWIKDPQFRISHVVIGSGEPGGIWRSMEHSMATLSPGSWMELPGYSIDESIAKNEGEKIDTQMERILRSHVAQYYAEYPVKVGVDQNFLNNYKVTEICEMKEAMGNKRCACGYLQMLESSFLNVILSEESRHCCPDCSQYQWLLTLEKVGPIAKLRSCGSSGNSKPSEPEVRHIRTNNVVLASGVFDTPNRAGFQGEECGSWRVAHGLGGFKRLQSTLKEAIARNPSYVQGLDPVIVIGSGLSAADAILELQSKGVSVIHIYYLNKGKIPLSNYNRNSYPEYSELYKQMKNMKEITHPQTGAKYIPIPDGQLVKYSWEGNFQIMTSEGNHFQSNECGQRASWVLVLAGSRPSLPFLSDHIKEKMGIKLNGPSKIAKEISADSIELPGTSSQRRSRLQIDDISNELLEEDGLFVTGSLAGDSTVRFAIGNNLGIAATLVKKVLGFHDWKLGE